MQSLLNDSLYIPPSLKQMIGRITEKPFSLICAGSGFGKTTAVLKFLEQVPMNTRYHWYTCYGESTEQAFKGLCGLISFADPCVGDFLKNLEMPTLNHLNIIASLMSEITCDQETILIFDNYQSAAFPAPYRLLAALSMHRCKKLHLVVLSHPLYADEVFSTTDPRIYYIPQQAFIFSTNDIRKLFAMNGTPIHIDQAERLFEMTEGWIAALRLHLTKWQHDGCLLPNSGIRRLMETAFWQPLNERQRLLFLGLSLLDTFTEAQAARLLGRNVMSDELWSCVYLNAFVRTQGNEYVMHTLLRTFLSEKLQALPDIVCESLYNRAGEACQTQGRYLQAVLFFIKAKNDLSALSVPLSSMDMVELVRLQTEPFALLLSRCHIEVLEGRWHLLLNTAVKAGLNNKMALARIALTRLTQLRDLQGSSDENRRNAAAALEIAASFQAYNDIEDMNTHYAAALKLLPDAQDFYVNHDPFTFCIPSVVYMFWRESGTLTRTAQLMHGSISNYASLSGRKGLGAPEMMEAEIALLAGNVEEAKKLTYLARGIAQRAGQDSLLFCADVVLTRCAILAGDGPSVKNELISIHRHALEGKEYLCATAAEAASGFLYSLMGIEQEIPDWLLTASSIRETLYPVSVPFALIVFLRHIAKHFPEELIGTAEAYLRETQELHHLLPALYFMLEEAVWYLKQAQQEKASECVLSALNLAIPDQVLLPFAEYYEVLGSVIDKAAESFGKKYQQQIRHMGHSYTQGVWAVHAFLEGISPLTAREREIAALAQQRISTKEIAATLSISPATVKNTLNKVYAKLGIRGKTELASRHF